MARYFFLSAIAVVLFCCHPSDESINRFSDSTLIKIADFQDRRQADSIYPYFGNANPEYRRHAVEAFGSLQDGAQIDRIGKLLLMDTEPAVRRAAAFALGQIKHPSCERILLGALVKEKVPEVLSEILQAYGKTTRQWKLDANAFMDDSLKSAGVAWSLYIAGTRGKTDEAGNAAAVELLKETRSESTRLGAAHYFARGARDFQQAENQLIVTASNDKSAPVRMAATLALGKIPSDSVLASLKKIIKSENDSRVIVNAIRALKGFSFREIKYYLYEALVHRDPHVGIAASEVIIDTLTPEDWIEVSSMTGQVTHPRMQANLYEAALRAGRNKDLALEAQRRYQNEREPYAKAAMLASLKHYPEAYEFVAGELRGASIELIRSTAAATLAAMSQSNNFSSALTAEFARLFADMINSAEDAAVLGSIAIALADSTRDYRNQIGNAAFLRSARKKLALPRDNEALQALESAIAHFENRKIDPVTNEFSHPVDWALVKTIPEDQRASIKTTRGTIIVRLLVNESPGTVANFVNLARQNYYDDNAVHRVVPNFVVQDGCNRGDGWGGEDYSIRSEFTPRPYRTGSMGMASAGKDTEGTQWFITHSPTPHLEGRYTLFAEVVEGQDVVDFLQVGDKITDVEIENFTGQ